MLIVYINEPRVKFFKFFILSYLMRIHRDATRPSNESNTFVILLRRYLHYNVNQHFQGRALQEAEGSFLRPATVKALCHTFFARGFAVLIKHSSSFNPHTRFLEHSAEWTVGLHRPLGILSRASTTLTPRLMYRLREKQFSKDCYSLSEDLQLAFGVSFRSTTNIHQNMI